MGIAPIRSVHSRIHMTPLAKKLAARIRASGPLTVAEYMSACLSDPEHGYYMRQEPFGGAGDFVTAPEVSQMFGELVGLWSVAAWELIGEPSEFVFAELGPGRGTLMADMVRTAMVKPAFLRAARFHLIETSPRLREVQEQALAPTGLTFNWHDTLEELPVGPTVAIANEFFDALPVRQFQLRGGQWAERVVGLDGNGAFELGLAPVEHQPSGPDLPDDTVVEASPVGGAAMALLAARFASVGGAVLVVDYGSATPGVGSTLQAVRDHKYHDPLETPGEADLTAHVDFSALARAATEAGSEVREIMSQGEFLIRMGLVERAKILGRGKEAKIRDEIAKAMERLASPKAMGQLFKVMAVSAPGQRLPIFDADRSRAEPAQAKPAESASTEPKSADDSQTVARPAKVRQRSADKTSKKPKAKRTSKRRRSPKPSPGHEKDRATKH